MVSLQLSVPSCQVAEVFWKLGTDNCEPLGGLAQLGERLLCKQGVTGSNPVASRRGWRWLVAGN